MFVLIPEWDGYGQSIAQTVRVGVEIRPPRHFGQLVGSKFFTPKNVDLATNIDKKACFSHAEPTIFRDQLEDLRW